MLYLHDSSFPNHNTTPTYREQSHYFNQDTSFIATYYELGSQLRGHLLKHLIARCD